MTIINTGRHMRQSLATVILAIAAVGGVFFAAGTKLLLLFTVEPVLNF